MSDQYTVPAGWYPDPLGNPQLRWWNGEGWTEQVSPAPEPIVMQQSTFAWKNEDAAPVVVQVPVVQAPVVQAVVEPEPVRAAPAVMTPAARELFALEAPRAAAKVEQPAVPNLPAAGYTNNYKQAPGAPVAVSTPETGYTKYAVTNPDLIPVPVSNSTSTPPRYFA